MKMRNLKFNPSTEFILGEAEVLRIGGKHSRTVKIKNLFFLIACFLLILIFLSGCATVPTRVALPTYNIKGTRYLSLISLCEARGVSWQYDTLTRTIVLSKDRHKINLMVGDTLALVDGSPRHLKNPVDIYCGILVVPYRFKERVLDVLFKKPYPASRVAVPLLKIKKVVIDPGHGGKDPGAIGRAGLREKDVNLDIAKRLKHLLQAEGITVIMTRSTDKFISLSQRAAIANNAQVDLFLSVHANANRVRRLHGLEVYYLSPKVNESRRALYAAKNAVLNLDRSCFASNSLDLKAILWDMIYTYNRAESIELGRSICRAVDRNLDTRILGIKRARFEVLSRARMPAILIEVGFLSNYNEERRLKNKYYRQQLAEAVAQGIKSYARDYTLVQAHR